MYHSFNKYLLTDTLYHTELGTLPQVAYDPVVKTNTIVDDYNVFDKWLS